MKINVKLFAAHRQLAGRRELDVEVDSGATAQDVWEAVKQAAPRLREQSGTVLVSINLEYASLTSPVQQGDQVAFIPPVSGGIGNWLKGKHV